MIEYIKGRITDLTPTYCVIETAGVGYLLNISLTTYSELQTSTEAKLFAYEAIREDAHTLFGFLTKMERELFLLLLSVSGVGAMTARMIMSSFTATELTDIIATGNVNAIKTVKGIGLKSAQRIIVDLKDKMGKVGGGEIDLTAASAKNEKAAEAVAALVMLGFQQSASQKTVDQILKGDPSLDTAKIIKKAMSLGLK